MVCEKDPLVTKVCELYEQISRLESLKPSKDVNMLFTQLVVTCMPPYPIDVTKLCKNIQEIRSKLIRLCGEAEGLLESHFSTLLGSYENPLHHLNIFPYYSNYLKLSQLEFNILTKHYSSQNVPTKIAFIGSGPLPLTSIVLASNHLPTTTFHNYDIDPSANSKALKLVSSDPDLSERMFFHTMDIMDVTNELKEFDVVFLAALVGMDKDEKVKVIDHLGKFMAPGAILMLRSAHGARAFLYPVVDPCDLRGFEVLSVFHPTDDVINSVVLARKFPLIPMTTTTKQFSVEQPTTILANKCFDHIEMFNPLNHVNLMDELAIDHQDIHQHLS
ncbi:Nicotianamine synthase [Corchorus capsularis]|uniref:Nicotianamine synthase n=1 Tax=Corchorus capsularis TaxID=210143 RepID=A0A1R3IUM0_COCAP|nr:Nicotianamine synthase [Corchorus capsularis]